MDLDLAEKSWRGLATPPISPPLGDCRRHRRGGGAQQRTHSQGAARGGILPHPTGVLQVQ
jgi:hypothetical protein